ncbi:MAG: glycoside hydrolase family 2 TIM barrel-domain containing protein [Lachnospiraceae bacterium]|jgi:hypothetical protein
MENMGVPCLRVEWVNGRADLSGIWQAEIGEDGPREMKLPGTLDESGIGHADSKTEQVHPDAGKNEQLLAENVIATRFTRKYTYTGEARISADVKGPVRPGRRVFVSAERARCLKLLVDGKEIRPFVPETLDTPHIYEITDVWNTRTEQPHRFTFLSDNSYPGLPAENILYSSTATDETQTNWNGIIGNFFLKTEPEVFILSIRVLYLSDTLSITCEISAPEKMKKTKGTLTLQSQVFSGSLSREVEIGPGITTVTVSGVRLKDRISRWDETAGSLYDCSAQLDLSPKKSVRKNVRFGIREFRSGDDGRLTLNGRRIFLRGEANCAEFPETGHPPMDRWTWYRILAQFQNYGVNCMRFHSWCPPEEAFAAADELGMMMQPELSHWNPRTAFESDTAYRYYRTEMEELLKCYANHPSFVMLTFGNELASGEAGHERMRELLTEAKKLDPTRLYANGSNLHYGDAGVEPLADFFTGSAFFGKPLRGTYSGLNTGGGIRGAINNRYPGCRLNYSETMAEIRQIYPGPVFGFEVGQFEVLPDFSELDSFHGISDPANYRRIKTLAEQKGFLDDWPHMVEATGELARIGYRAEVEAALSTPKMSGLSLLGLQDFPGQGTALVGMLNSHLDPKPFPFAKADAFNSFFRGASILLQISRYTYESSDKEEAPLLVANYNRGEIYAPFSWSVYETDPDFLKKPESVQELEVMAGQGQTVFNHMGHIWKCAEGTQMKIGTIPLDFSLVRKPTKLFYRMQLGDVVSVVPVWVYPAEGVPECPESVYETKRFDEKAREVLRSGGRVYLSPDSDRESLPRSIQAQFTTDFWSVGTFPGQEGSMGQLIDCGHPLFDEFPTEFHTNWQWWPMASQRAVILPRRIPSIVAEMDSYATMRPMAQMFECRCGGGSLLFSSMGLQNLQQYPEGRALQRAVYHYMESGKFRPEQELPEELIASLVN